MDETKKALETLRTDIEDKEKRKVLRFDEFLDVAKREPERSLRDIFQLFHDMVKSCVGKGEDEYPDDPESIGFIKYDCSKIFVRDSDNPFFADRLFANRFVRQVESLRQGSRQNRIYVYEGPHGSGKSTFLNNLLQAFEEYTATEEGQSFEIFWDIDIGGGEKVNVSCPSHDYPMLVIPKSYRAAFLDKLLSEKMSEFKYKLSHEKEYEWLFKREVCTICKSLFWALFEKLGSLDKVFDMIKVRNCKFDRRLGEGISVFNPGDSPIKEAYLTVARTQRKLDTIFGANLVKYVFSPLAKTNNGIYVLMDIKSFNKDRLLELHNVISEGVHKVNGMVEERISSLFLALMNPEDKESIKEEKAESFQGRIQYNKVSYVLDVPTEVKTYYSVFGEQIDLQFLPRVLKNFARVIISSRMNAECAALKEWILDMKKYNRYCDEAGLLLRMAINGGTIPQWLSEEDKKKMTAVIRRKLIATGELEGVKGFSGRESIDLLGEFLRRYGGKPKLINMDNVCDFFKHKVDRDTRNENIPKNFIGSLVNWYDYLVLNEIKESLYFYNKEQIQKDILNYIYAVNYDVGSKIKCEWTQQELEVSTEFFKMFGSYFTGIVLGDHGALEFAKETQKKFRKVIAQCQNKKITGEKISETELYQELFTAYTKNLKEKLSEPFLKSDNFKEAVKCFGTEKFKTFDTRLKEHVAHMTKNLEEKFGYSEQGAKEICLYAIEQKLVDKFPSKHS
ncbi:MAG: serine protein kinase PrkA [Candidatus Yanofskybacteria bacterium]|nr:serine protein kinase PrkA [Candidatus Yanofskybacteria bacterium]